MFLRIVAMTGLAWLLPAASGFSEVQRQSMPEWVAAAPATRQEAGEGSYHYHSVDLQTNVETGETYERIVVELLNESGVEEFSQLDFTYQPEYETLVMHELLIERNGETQNRLPDVKIETLRREEGMEESLYDGELTALIVLEDIRPGDVLTYAFTTRGANPVFKGHVHRFHRLGYGVPVDHVRRRVLWDPRERDIRWKVHSGDGQWINHHEAGEMHELLWDRRNVPRTSPEDDTPGWMFDYPWLEYSDYEDWNSFGEWALPLFTKEEPLPDEIAKLCAQIRDGPGTDAEKIVTALAWVQRNIRYLGSFFGAHTHEPYPLEEICRRRFGDCKDKGVLTVAILRELGYDAAPALVNTASTRAVETYLQGHSAFNHLVVHLKFEGRDYMLDPTATYRRGTLDQIHAPGYSSMFVVRPGAKALMPVPDRSLDMGETVIRDTYIVDEGYKGADLTVETVVTGHEADSLRSYFARTPKDEINESYEKFYADSFPGIESAAPIEINDNEQANRIEIKECYRIPEFWEWSKDEPRWSVWISADFLESRLSFPEDAKRTQPLAHTFPSRVRQTIDVNLPTAWQVEESTLAIDQPAFQYRSATRKKDKGLIMEFEYRSLADVVDVADYEKHQQAMAELRDDLSLQLRKFRPEISGSEKDESPAEAGTVDHSIGIMLVAGGSVLGALIGIMLSVGLWFWDPQPREANPASPVGLGGWLVLPVIGCLLLPVLCIYQVVDYHGNLDEMAAILADGSGFGGWRLYYLTGSFCNSLLVVLAIFQLVLLFRRRTSFPWVFIGISACIAISNGILAWMESGLEDLDTSTGNGTEAGRGAFRLLVWGAYMIMSQRVRATFIRRRRPVPPPVPVAEMNGMPVQP